MDCVTPSNPNGLHIEYGIPEGLICINILCLTHYSVGFDCPYKSVYDQTNFFELSTRGRGRSRKTWEQCVRDDMKLLGLHPEWAVFRDMWRDLIWGKRLTLA